MFAIITKTQNNTGNPNLKVDDHLSYSAWQDYRDKVYKLVHPD